MNTPPPGNGAPSAASKRRNLIRALLALLIVACVVYVVYVFAGHSEKALTEAMQSLLNDPNPDRQLVAKAILGNFLEVRSNARQWSAVYWGCTFFAAIFSAAAALILKFESLLRDDASKKDWAAILSVLAALLITVSTSGDFQKKWQANRSAAADLERMGYGMLSDPAVNTRTSLATIGDILHERQMTIIGLDSKTRGDGASAHSEARQTTTPSNTEAAQPQR